MKKSIYCHSLKSMKHTNAELIYLFLSFPQVLLKYLYNLFGSSVFWRTVYRYTVI